MAGQRRDKPLCLFLFGPTASGKTQLAMHLAERLPVDIVSVDSAMIYRDMNIGTAKPDAETLRRYPHGLVDIRDPHETYSVAEFLVEARELARRAAESGRIPLLVGGTMLYFRAAITGLSSLPEGDPAIRRELEARASAEGWPALHAELARVDPATAARLASTHSQRIARALEVYRLTGEPLSNLQDRSPEPPYQSFTDDFRICQIALGFADRSRLHQRIEWRFRQMVEQGLVEEVADIRSKYPVTAEHSAMRSVGYRQVWQYLEGECDRQDMLQRGEAATRQLAKRQLTWLRSWDGAHFLEVDGVLSDPRELELTEAAMHLISSELS